MAITLADKDSILKRLYDDDPEVWAYAQADAIELIEKQSTRIDELQERLKWWLETYDITMPCGHKNRYLFTKDETQYCAMCALEESKSELMTYIRDTGGDLYMAREELVNELIQHWSKDVSLQIGVPYRRMATEVAELVIQLRGES